LPEDRFASFAIALPLYRYFDYSIDTSIEAIVGARYRLPFGSGVKTGILLALSSTSQHAPERIKAVSELIDPTPVFEQHMITLAQWMADYYQQPIGEVLFQCLPAFLRGTNPDQSSRIKMWRSLELDAPTLAALQTRSPRQFEIYQALARSPGGLHAADLRLINQAWHKPIAVLEQKEAVYWEWADQIGAHLSVSTPPQLAEQQQLAVDRIDAKARQFSVHLLDGITGSGKTEVYLHLIKAQLDASQQVIYLVPEIGLTNQLIDRIRDRFGEQFVISHSALTDRQRYQAWDRFRRGEAAIMLGTRSSLFAQSEKLGLIIIDEEHDLSYRQEDGIRYHARDVAIKRAQMLDIPCLLGSATPSLESIANGDREHYFLHRLEQRPTAFPPPSITLVDIRNSRLDAGCSQQTLTRIETHLQQQGQVLVYLNRRGFAPVVMCHECGWQALCRSCDSRLTLHQSVQRVICHHCGQNDRLPPKCPECGHGEIKHYGIGTEQLEQELAGRFPQIPVIRVDRDTISSRDALKLRLAQLQSGEPCIMVGTQMIAKGHDYPSITLSVILDADQALFSASYRASERLVQTVIQVSGRAGRGDREGEALLQTRFADHPLMQSLVAKNYRALADDILLERKMLAFPPYARVVMFRSDAIELKLAMKQLDTFKTIVLSTGRISEISCIGPLPALMTRRIGRYRAQLCLLSVDYQALRSVLQEAMPAIQKTSGSAKVKWSIDVDAYDL
jgi:primosomal protein N' (replication factor Y)